MRKKNETKKKRFSNEKKNDKKMKSISSFKDKMNKNKKKIKRIGLKRSEQQSLID